VQPGVRCLQRLDPGLDLPLEAPSPCGELSLAEHFQPAIPVEQVARNDTQLLLPLVYFCARSQGRSYSSLADWCRFVLGDLWWRSLGWRGLLLGLAEAFFGSSHVLVQA
jgi:hypothetical protein